MGRSYLFECPKCCYKAEVSGGTDSGLDFSVQTAACRDCKTVFDSVVRLRLPDGGLKLFSDFQRLRLRKTETENPPSFESVLNRLPIETRKFKWAQFKIRCPVSFAHRVNAWNEPGKCPRCGTFMEKNSLPFRFWE
jgi:hypothetical protein